MVQAELEHGARGGGTAASGNLGLSLSGKASLLLSGSLWLVLLEQLEQVGGCTNRVNQCLKSFSMRSSARTLGTLQGALELVEARWDLQALEKDLQAWLLNDTPRSGITDLLLALDAHVTWPADEAGHVLGWLKKHELLLLVCTWKLDIRRCCLQCAGCAGELGSAGRPWPPLA